MSSAANSDGRGDATQAGPEKSETVSTGNSTAQPTQRDQADITRDRIVTQDFELRNLRRMIAYDAIKLRAATEREAEIRRHASTLEHELLRHIAILDQERLQFEHERRQFAQTLDVIYRSTSWWLTTPIRVGRRLLGGLLRRERQNLPPDIEKAVPAEVIDVVLENEGDQPDISTIAYKPLISLIMPVYEIDPLLLTKAIESVQAQSYQNWELCICDDGSKRDDIGVALDRFAAVEPRIKLTRNERNAGISAATNRALAMANGEFVAFVDHDDALTPAALAHYICRLNDQRDIDVIYGDEDKIDPAGKRSEPFYKPDWSPIFFCGVMYVGHLLMARRTLVEEVGGLDSTYDGVQDFELMLRLSERTQRIEHVRKIVYHWRSIPGSLAASTTAKPDITLKQAAAVNAHLRRRGIRATVHPHPTLPHRVQLMPASRSDWPLVSIIIPSKDAPDLIGRCLDTIFAKTTYRNFEVIVIDNGTTDRRALDILAAHPVKVVRFAEPFNFSKANNVGAAEARGEYLVLLNNDTEVIDGSWIDTLVSLMELPQVGAVGPLLLYADRTVQHAGVALGPRGTADHVMRGIPADSDGYAGSLACTREVSAVTAACLMVRRSVYQEIGGMKDNYATHYQDVDFCLRLRAVGYSLLYTPATSLIHHESATRGAYYDQLDRALLKDAWDKLILRGDPYHNPAVPAYA